MPLDWSELTTPSGRKVLRGYSHGEVLEKEADAFMKLTYPGQPYFGVSVLMVSSSDSSVSAGARKAFAKQPPEVPPKLQPAAVVLPNLALRLAGRPR